MSQVWYSPYALTPKRSLNARTPRVPRRGALLRTDGGFADLHPWPELGDLALEVQLKALAEGHPTSQVATSLRLARIDGQARAEKRSLFAGLTLPISHFLVTDIFETIDATAIAAQGFDRIKIKMGRDLTNEAGRFRDLAANAAAARCKLRIDFNASCDDEHLGGFLTSLTTAERETIDFLEDPLPYDGAVWEGLRGRFGLRLAADRVGEIPVTRGVDVVVVKPAYHPIERFLKASRAHGLPLVVTSNLDHPVGQLFAAWTAGHVLSEDAQLEPCGLLTHRNFEPNAFSERLGVTGTRLEPPEGTGIGFDDLLEKLEWKRLG